MRRSPWISPIALGVLLAIGCGGSKPQDAAATQQSNDSGTMQVALAPAQAAPASTPSTPSSATTGGATIKGTVRLLGSPPKPAPIAMSADPVCQQQHSTPVTSEEVVVNGQGGLKNVFVYVKDGIKGSTPAPTTPVTLDQSGCWYKPHIFGIQVGQPLSIVNSDATLHNINAKPTANQPFNVAQPVKGMKTTKTFTKPEVMVKFKCNVHPWMNAYVGVVDHPFFNVSDDQGGFTLAGLPAGTYTVEAWHEKFGTQTQSVTLADGETKSIELTFKTQ